MSDHTDQELRDLIDSEIAEHVGEIMFDSLSRPDPDCTLCKRGIETGAWAAFGVEDPFSEDDE